MYWMACAGVLFFIFLGVSTVDAQDVIAPAPALSVAPAAVQDNQNDSPMQVFIPSGAGSGLGTATEPFRYGSLVIRPHLLYRFLYGMGISSSPGQQQNTIIQQVSPGVMFDLGDHWTLDYTPTLSFYSSSDLRDTLDHSVQLGWGTACGNWFLHASQGFSISSDPQVETAAQTDQQNYSTAVSAKYQFNDKMSVDIGLNQSFNYISNGQTSTNSNYLIALTSSRSWSTVDWFNYAFWPWLDAGIGAGFGYNQQDNSPDTFYEQYQARIRWRMTEKISLQLNGGLQDQQYSSGGTGDLLTPVMGASIQYQPFQQTQLSLSASRSLSPSAFQSQSSESTSVSVDLNQRLLGKLYLDVGAGYGFTQYSSTSAANLASRSDDYYSFNTRLSCRFPKRGTLSVFYQYSDNSSSQSGFLSSTSSFSYSSSQIGVELGYQY
jgi:hypothetical protein